MTGRLALHQDRASVRGTARRGLARIRLPRLRDLAHQAPNRDPVRKTCIREGGWSPSSGIRYASKTVAVMKDVSGNVTQAAERAGIERESMHRLLKKHGVRSEDFKPRGT